MNQTDQRGSKIHHQLAAARDVLAATGKSPRKLGDESRLRVIDWIYRWGYTSSTAIQLLLNRTAGGYAQKLVRQGWLNFTKTQSGSPVGFYRLTEQGLQEAERFARKLYHYPEINPCKIIQSQVRHYTIAQSATISGLKAGSIVHFETERMFSQHGDKLGVKRPDVVWHISSDLRVAVEVELSAKWGRYLDEFVLGVARSLQKNKDETPKFHRFVIISDSKAIIERYREAMQPGEDLSIWKKNQRGYWAIEKTVKVPEWLINQIDFQLISK